MCALDRNRLILSDLWSTNKQWVQSENKVTKIFSEINFSAREYDGPFQLSSSEIGVILLMWLLLFLKNANFRYLYIFRGYTLVSRVWSKQFDVRSLPIHHHSQNQFEDIRKEIMLNVFIWA